MVKCSHKDNMKFTHTDKYKCPQCVKTNDKWVHLRMCLECGQIGCCDSSKNTHATNHYKDSKHPLIRSIEPGEKWIWCYPDEEMVGEISDVKNSNK